MAKQSPKSIIQTPRRSVASAIKHAVAEAGDTLPLITVPPDLKNPHPYIVARIASDGGEAALSKIQMRARRIEDTFLKAMEVRGHRLHINKSDMSRHFMVGKEAVTYFLYEPSRQRRVPLTAKELASPVHNADGRSWRQVLVPSGGLRFGINVRYGSDQMWNDGVQPLESHLATFVIAMEVIAAEKTKERIESEARSQEYQREIDRKLRPALRKLRDKARWERLRHFSKDYHQAENIRRFLAALTEVTASDKKLAVKAQRLKAFAQPFLEKLDPVSYDPVKIFRQFEKPVPPPSGMEYIALLHSIP